MAHNPKFEILFISVVLFIAGLLFFYDVEFYGDVFQFLALYLGIIIFFYERNFKRVIMLGLTACAVLGLVYAIKYGFVWLATHNAEYAQISMRPCCNKDFNGFPSGHTAAAFIAVGFAWHFYSKKWVVLLTLLALFVPPSRVLSEWHTIVQVIAGGFLSVSVSYIAVYLLQRFPLFRNA